MRVLVVDQLTPDLVGDRDPKILDLLRSKEQPALQISDLTDSDLRQINADASDEQISRAKGRPLYVLLGQDIESTIATRLRERLAGQDGNALAYLAFAALAGPVEGIKLREVFGKPFSVRERMNLHGLEDTQLSKNVVPILSPDPLADTAVAQWIETMGAGGWEDIAAVAAIANPTAFFMRMASMGSSTYISENHSYLHQLWEIFCAHAPKDAQARSKQFANDIDVVLQTTSGFSSDILERIDIFSNALSYHRDTQAKLIKALVNRVYYYRSVQAFKEVERWGARLLTLAQAPAWQQDQAIQYEFAKGSRDALITYGKAGSFEEMERWGAQLLTLAQAPAWQQDQEIQQEFAKGSRTALILYGKAGSFEEMERWGARLLTLAQAPAWQQDQTIQLEFVLGLKSFLNCTHGAQYNSWRATLTKSVERNPNNFEIRRLAEQSGVWL